MAASCAASFASSAAAAVTVRNVDKSSSKPFTSKAKANVRAARTHVVVRAADGAATEAPPTSELYEVELPKPIEVKFARGNDGMGWTPPLFTTLFCSQNTS
jgi:hypothetical protein